MVFKLVSNRNSTGYQKDGEDSPVVIVEKSHIMPCNQKLVNRVIELKSEIATKKM